jgi:hypothetical protein
VTSALVGWTPLLLTVSTQHDTHAPRFDPDLLLARRRLPGTRATARVRLGRFEPCVLPIEETTVTHSPQHSQSTRAHRRSPPAAVHRGAERPLLRGPADRARVLQRIRHRAAAVAASEDTQARLVQQGRPLLAATLARNIRPHRGSHPKRSRTAATRDPFPNRPSRTAVNVSLAGAMPRTSTPLSGNSGTTSCRATTRTAPATW